MHSVCRVTPLLLGCLVWASAAFPQTLIEAKDRTIDLFTGQGGLIKLDDPAGTVFLANPDIADVNMKSPTLLYIYGKAAGETTLFVIDENEEITLGSAVKVGLNAAAMDRAAHAAVQAGSFSVTEADGTVLIRGRVPTIAEAHRIEEVVQGLAGEGTKVINTLTFDKPAQINLQVRIAEVSRSVAENLGISWSTLSGNGLNGGSGVEDGYSLATSVARGSFRASVQLEALKREGLVSILSEPNLTARSGDKASFLAGGRFPYQTEGSDGEVRVVFEPYGVELEFEPEVQRADQIKLNVRTQIRELDFSNGSTSNTQNLPLILERSAETTIEVASGQSFAIAGLFSATTQQNVDKLPALGDLPVLGALFRSTKYQSGESELVIIVTPYLVEPASPNAMAAPTDGFAPSGSFVRNVIGELSQGVPIEAGSEGVSVRSIHGKAGFLLQ
ncbi:type II and III secretion system protein family protein [Celeribacter indicus]|uniref:Type II and III secretion system protein n=1 Tax=Celeribacter indicus TaxID=1208324 RepID=A0A0B5E609_9RHOB|nr:type II and III secretion system protein family protein [Celeribacter indicus]AJE48835.1 type II and III secretion system protein [Celeribacter indicus]SDW38689.1 pilus assembly protein CpaC [Celeribacter indicus]